MDTIEYDASLRRINLTDEMISVLKGLPIEEQAKHFRVVIEYVDWDNIYGERIVNERKFSEVSAEECKYAHKWIVKDGIIVGIVFSDDKGKLTYASLNDQCETYFLWEKNGIGGRHFEEYCTLIWKP